MKSYVDLFGIMLIVVYFDSRYQFISDFFKWTNIFNFIIYGKKTAVIDIFTTTSHTTAITVFLSVVYKFNIPLIMLFRASSWACRRRRLKEIGIFKFFMEAYRVLDFFEQLFSFGLIYFLSICFFHSQTPLPFLIFEF